MGTQSLRLSTLAVLLAGLALLGCDGVDLGSLDLGSLFGDSAPAEQQAPVAPVVPTPTPVLSQISPVNGPQAGGTEITLLGSGFQPDTGVILGSQAAPSITYVNANILRATTPPTSSSAVDVFVVNTDGKNSVLRAAFTYIAPIPPADVTPLPTTQPTPPPAKPVLSSITSIAPNHGLEGVRTSVTMLGAALKPGSLVLFDGLLAESAVVGAQVISAIAPVHAAGVVDVVVLPPSEPAIVLTGAFTYDALPTDPPPPPPDPPAASRVDSFAPAFGPVTGGTMVTIQGANLKPGTAVLFGGLLGLNTQIVNPQVITSVAPAQPQGSVHISVLPPNEPANAVGVYDYQPLPPPPPPPPPDPGELAALVGAISLDNKHILVTFSQPMGDGADDPTHYGISGTDSAFLVVMEALPQSDPSQVMLRTLTQDFDDYTLHVVGINDIYGRPMATPGDLAPPLGFDPTRADFRGTAPTGAEIDEDTDGDNFGDWFEMKGWLLTVRYANGTTTTSHVTSDPLNPDTDGDGLDDSVENQWSFDPRTDDSDADHLNDYDEFNLYFSDPLNQDTDFDGIGDELEVNFFFTSPIIADTDGDGFSDSEELFVRNRNPRLADLPSLQITVGEVRVDVDETYSYTDETNTVQSRTDTSSAAFAQSDTQGLSTADAATNTLSTEFGVTVGASYKWGGVDSGATLMGEVSDTESIGSEYTSTVTQESSSTAQQEFQNSITESLEFSERREVTRTVNGARVSIDLNISSTSDIAFSLSNLEITALQQDRANLTRFLPVASLVSQTPTLTYNLGPLVPPKGPIVFNNTAQIFPELALQLLAEPRGLVFKIANFDITDEFGRNLAFIAQDVNERTAGLIIDYGNGVVESYHVATASTFDESGRTAGIRMKTALEDILGLDHIKDDTDIVDPDNPSDDALTSYGTVENPVTKLQLLSRIRGVQDDLSFDPGAAPRFWAVITTATIPPDTKFNDINLQPGETYTLAFVEDNDHDGLYAREEFLYGSSDFNVDTDGDGLDDYFEAKTGWDVQLAGHNYHSTSDPTLIDSDGDGVDDLTELDIETDARKADTDEDGLSDGDELNGYEVTLASGSVLEIESYGRLSITRRIAIDAGSDGIVDTIALVTDEALDAVGTDVGADTVTILPGDDGLVETRPDGDDDAIREVVHDFNYATNPLNRDTDADGQSDGREALLGGNPNNPLDGAMGVDTDQDGITDFNETVRGWEVKVAGQASYRVFSDPLEADSDNDGLPDFYELKLLLDPNLDDTDGDGLTDFDEQTADALDDLLDECALYANCHIVPGNSAQLGTSALDDDTDGDSRTDGDELTESWVVSVHGQSPYAVFSDPLKKDTDLDGVNDNKELDNGTDPRKSDTDGDGESDDYEINDQPDRNPLRKDILITFDYDAVLIIGDCDDGTGGGSAWSGSIKLEFPDGHEETKYSMSGCNGVDENDRCGAISAETFILNEGETFRAFSTDILEDDPSVPPRNLGNFTKTFSYTSSDTNVTWDLEDQGGNACHIRVSASISRK